MIGIGGESFVDRRKNHTQFDGVAGRLRRFQNLAVIIKRMTPEARYRLILCCGILVLLLFAVSFIIDISPLWRALIGSSGIMLFWLARQVTKGISTRNSVDPDHPKETHIAAPNDH